MPPGTHWAPQFLPCPLILGSEYPVNSVIVIVELAQFSFKISCFCS